MYLAVVDINLSLKYSDTEISHWFYIRSNQFHSCARQVKGEALGESLS